MNGKLNKKDAERFLRAVTASLEAVAANNPGKTYGMGYTIGLAQPLLNKSAAELKAELSKVTTFIKKFTDQDILLVDVQIQEFGGVDAQIAEQTQQNYEASKEIEGKSGKVLAVAK